MHGNEFCFHDIFFFKDHFMQRDTFDFTKNRFQNGLIQFGKD